jgi:hypothetical protein
VYSIELPDGESGDINPLTMTLSELARLLKHHGDTSS